MFNVHIKLRVHIIGIDKSMMYIKEIYLNIKCDDDDYNMPFGMGAISFYLILILFFIFSYSHVHLL